MENDILKEFILKNNETEIRNYILLLSEKIQFWQKKYNSQLEKIEELTSNKQLKVKIGTPNQIAIDYLDCN